MEIAQDVPHYNLYSSKYEAAKGTPKLYLFVVKAHVSLRALKSPIDPIEAFSN